MDNFDLVLKKHFQKKSSQEEEKLISKYKKENLHEYNVYKHLWNSSTIVSVREYDANAAWLKVMEAKKKIVIPLKRKFRKIAAVAAILVIGVIGSYIIQQRVMFRDISTLASKTERGKEIVLNDGTRVWLNRQAQLTYPARFGDNSRTVSLNGEAFFDVFKNPDRPFVIKTNYSEVTVLGTSFNINASSENSKISVTTGKVKVKSVHTGESIDLLPDFTAIITKESMVKSPTNNLNYMSWKTGKFIFKDTPLSEVIKELNSFYDKPIVVKNQYNNCKFTADFDNANLSDIIKILSLSCNLKIIKKPSGYEIH